MSHTPGPWMIYDDGVIASGSVRIPDHTVLRSGAVKGATIGEAMANARLIAAAPELLELAKQYAAECGECHGTGYWPAITDGCSDQDCSDCRHIREVIDGLTPSAEKRVSV